MQQHVTLQLEYDVNVMESVRHATGPLIVEVERHRDEELGLVLVERRTPRQQEDEVSVTSEDPCPSSSGIYIERIVPASVADRCGALHIGDRILAVDDVPLDIEDEMTGRAERALRLLRDFSESRGCSKLQILPYHVAGQGSRQSRPNSEVMIIIMIVGINSDSRVDNDLR